MSHLSISIMANDTRQLILKFRMRLRGVLMRRSSLLQIRLKSERKKIKFGRKLMFCRYFLIDKSIKIKHYSLEMNY